MLAHKGYDNHNCHNKPQIRNGMECEWRHARKRWSWEFEDFQKHVSWELTFENVDRKLGYLPLRQTVEIGARPWCEKLGPTMKLKLSSDHDVEKLRCTDCRGVVSIVWHERLLRIVSLLVSKCSKPMMRICEMYIERS